MGQSEKRFRNALVFFRIRCRKGPRNARPQNTVSILFSVCNNSITNKNFAVIFIILIIITKFKLRYVALIQLNEEGAKYMKLNLNSYKIHNITMQYFFVEIKHVRWSLPRDCNNRK